MNKFSQSGKGLSGFFFGLILATVIIAGILLYLNQGGQNAFKIPAPSKQPAETEILKLKNQPKEDIQPEPADQNALSEPDVAKEAEQSDAEKAADKQPVADKADEVEEKAGEPEREEPDGQAVRKKALTEEREQTVREKAQKKDAETVKKQAVKPSKETEKKASKEEKKAAKEKVAPKPTPEQILNSGSIEKARSAAAKEVQKMKTFGKAEATRIICKWARMPTAGARKGSVPNWQSWAYLPKWSAIRRDIKRFTACKAAICLPMR